MVAGVDLYEYLLGDGNLLNLSSYRTIPALSVRSWQSSYDDRNALRVTTSGGAATPLLRPDFY